MKWIMRAGTVIGVLMLFSGIAWYGKLALTGEGTLLGPFLLIMGCLFFFNLPTILQKRMDRRNAESQDGP